MAKVEISFQALKIKVEDKKDSADDCVRFAEEQMKRTIKLVRGELDRHNKKMEKLSKLPIIQEKMFDGD